MNAHNADLKLPLIDLEADNTATGGKQELINSGQPERLSEGGDSYCVYWIHTSNHSDALSQGYIGITCNFKERLKAHRKNKKKTKLTDAIKAYGWENLHKDILFHNLSLQKALDIEHIYRIMPNIGWNLQKGGELGVDKSWYNLSENKRKHSLATSVNTKLGILNKDTVETRSNRAKLSRINNKESYKNVSVGSNNGKAKLNEDQVIKIKCELLPSEMTNKEIGLVYGVKPYVIQFIRIGKTWKHIVCDSPAHK
jgi:predicted GIY-YIG superfamily endonuclease